MGSSHLLARWTGAIVLAALPWCAAASQRSETSPLVALISELSGDASSRVRPGAPSSPARRFDALAVGATLELGPKSHGVVVLAGGERFALGPGARATVAATQLTQTSGPVKALPSLPTLPRLVALDDSRPSGPLGGVRLRGTVISRLHPSYAVLATDPITLRFDRVDGASKYAVEMEDAAGRRLFAAETTTAEVPLPSGLLAPGATFHWTVRTLDQLGAEARGTSQFRTLSADQAQIRDALRRADASEDDAAFLAEVDRRLGLYPQALDGFRAALAGAPDDASLLRAIRWLEARAPGGR